MMDETAQVNTVNWLGHCSVPAEVICNDILIIAFFQLLYLPVLHRVVQTHFVRQMLKFLCVSVMMVTKAMDTTAQVRLLKVLL